MMELACGGRDVTPWTLYPDDYGVFDRDTGCQSYFHRHDGATHEAGHFHTVRLFPDHTVHLVAISMARDGWPQALFTLNLWAIGDRYESGAALKRYARRFRIDETRGDARLVRFVNLVFQAFTPQIERLQEGKITRLAEHRLANPGVDPFNDRSLEILSRLAIDVRARPTHSMREVQA
ncbi:MAG: hypothetical protein HYR86_04225 [Candidatus Rokubacteria bacterium]|nr:hypothetical protein [Candidatus Rokubacteria bacterium]